MLGICAVAAAQTYMTKSQCFQAHLFLPFLKPRRGKTKPAASKSNFASFFCFLIPTTFFDMNPQVTVVVLFGWPCEQFNPVRLRATLSKLHEMVDKN